LLSDAITVQSRQAANYSKKKERRNEIELRMGHGTDLRETCGCWNCSG